ncbi:MAG TPA: hypothetical protein VMH80_26825 [Bryobacteraceae bacterium]|nr:hypothetical protein [Bryobacteraceae bacterium]
MKGAVRLFASALVTLVLGAGILAPVPAYHVERTPTADGAELITIFGHQHEPTSGAQDVDVPLVAILRDSLGDSDPRNDRLRYVWILTRTRPTPWQRAVSALSFAFFRPGSQHRAHRVPSPVLDMAAPAKSVLGNLASDSLQALQLDPMGMPVRSTTRTYRSNSSDYRKLQIFQALGALDDFKSREDAQNVLSDAELREVYSRLSLSTRTFGGLVRERSLSAYFDQQASQLQENRGHNWELLRQRAEMSGLYFEPLALAGRTPSAAVLWIAREDLATRQKQRFSGQFLGIANPWTDDRLLHWTGYTEVRYFDSDNRMAPPDAPGAQARQMIPLAFYSLDYPRVPLLLADFRDSLKPKRRELVREGADSLLTGVFGITRYGNFSFLAADTAWSFVRSRHGAANNRTARLQAYSKAREFLAADSSLSAGLKSELSRRLDHLALNPLENGASAEATVARQQYAALLAYAQSRRGLAAKLEKDRRKELEAYTRSPGIRLLSGVARILTRGPHVDPAHPNPAVLAGLDSYRRTDSEQQFLSRLLASSPRPEVVWDADAVRDSVERLSAEPAAGPQVPRLIGQVFERSADNELRAVCLRALERLNTDRASSGSPCLKCVAAHEELLRLSLDPNTAESWRELSRLYLHGGAVTPEAAIAHGE